MFSKKTGEGSDTFDVAFWRSFGASLGVRFWTQPTLTVRPLPAFGLFFLIFCLFLSIFLPLSPSCYAHPSKEAKDIITCQGAMPACPVPYAIVISVDTGQVLFGKNIDMPFTPSSLTKMVLIDLIFQEAAAQRISLKETALVSKKAYRRLGSSMFLRLNQQVSLHDLIKGVIVHSGNDASCVLAEHVWGSEEEGARQLTMHMKKIGGLNSHFFNVTGLPHPGHVSTCRDLARLAIHTITTFPKAYSFYYNIPQFTFNGIRQYNRHEGVRDGWADGLKTGKTDQGGFGIAASSGEKGKRLLVLVNGAESNRQRHEVARGLLNWGTQRFRSVTFFSKGSRVVSLPLWRHKKEEALDLVSPVDIKIWIPKHVLHKVSVSLRHPNILITSVKKGAQLGSIHVCWPGNAEGISFPLLAKNSVTIPGTALWLWKKLVSAS